MHRNGLEQRHETIGRRDWSIGEHHLRCHIHSRLRCHGHSKSSSSRTHQPRIALHARANVGRVTYISGVASTFILTRCPRRREAVQRALVRNPTGAPKTRQARCARWPSIPFIAPPGARRSRCVRRVAGSPCAAGTDAVRGRSARRHLV